MGKLYIVCSPSGDAIVELTMPNPLCRFLEIIEIYEGNVDILRRRYDTSELVNLLVAFNKEKNER
jgi:hypothetical protein